MTISLLLQLIFEKVECYLTTLPPYPRHARNFSSLPRFVTVEVPVSFCNTDYHYGQSARLY